MNDLNSLPSVRQSDVDAMNKQAEKKFGKVPGIEEFDQQIPVATAAILAVPTEEPEQQEEPVNTAAVIESEPIVQKEPEKPQESDQARNFRAIREKAERAERERDEALKLVRELAAQQKPQEQAQEEPDTFGINPDDIVEGKHLSKVGKEIKELKKQLAFYQQQTSLTATEAKLKSQFPDFDSVVSKENLETFNMAYPELAQTLNSTQDLYTKAASAYKMIKQFGVYKSEPQFDLEKETAKKNVAKPRPLASVSPQQGDSPLSRANAFANGLTPDLQAQLRKEMEEARRGY